jgi:mono/diheme cytochrome c family protein
MNNSYRAPLFVALAAMLLLSGKAFSQGRNIDLGKREFDASCAVCHGTDGKGQGPFLEFLRRTPTDLTTLAKRNGGVFPINRVFETIEGAAVPSHGSRDMPIWGAAYRVEAGEYFADVPYNPEIYVRTRVLSLVEYINRLQVR